MRRGLTVRGTASAFTLSAVLFVPLGLWSFGVPPPSFGTAAPPPPIALIQTMSELATTRVHISDDIEGANTHYRGKWRLHGEVILGVDLSRVSYARTDPDRREAVLLLPQPHLVSSKVDHERSEEMYIHWVSWVPYTSKQVLRDEVWRKADLKIQRLGQEQAHVEQARVQAERVLERLFKGVGWDVRFQWADRPTNPVVTPASADHGHA